MIIPRATYWNSGEVRWKLCLLCRVSFKNFDYIFYYYFYDMVTKFFYGIAEIPLVGAEDVKHFRNQF